MMNTMTNQSGMASIESIALITVFSTLVAYALGLFVVIHTGILNSIAARTYAWETFSHRTNLTFFRDNRGPGSLITQHTKDLGYRAHTITSEKSPNTSAATFFATERYISSVPPDEMLGRNAGAHARLGELVKRERNEINPVWIRTVYGICLNAQCGGE